MVLNRVLLLAACITLMLCAMVFTISCSGDDGKDGKNGTACTADQNSTTGGIDIICDGVVKGTLIGNGPKGDKGDKGDPGAVEGLPSGTCLIKKVGATWNAICDGEDLGPVGNNNISTNPTGGCAVTMPDQYNDNELLVSCSATKVYLCNGYPFNKEGKGLSSSDPQEVCHNSKRHSEDLNANKYQTNDHRTFYMQSSSSTTGFHDGNTWNLDGNTGIIRANFTCTSINSAPSATNPVYDPNQVYCSSPGVLTPLCGGATYNICSFCQNQAGGRKGVKLRCGICTSTTFTAATGSNDGSYDENQFCWYGKNDDYLGDQGFSGTPLAYLNVHPKVLNYCAWNAATAKGSAFNPFISASDVPPSGVPMNRMLYSEDGAEYFAFDMMPSDATPGSYYTTLCQNNTIMGRCYGTSGDTATVNKPQIFNASTEFCRPLAGNATIKVEVKPLCGTDAYALALDRSKRVYDDKITFCEGGRVVKKCGGVSFDPQVKFCWDLDKTTHNYCTGNGQQSYDPRVTFCTFRPNGLSYISSYCKVGGDDVTKGVSFEKFNENGWNWAYCLSMEATDAATQADIDYKSHQPEELVYILNIAKATALFGQTFTIGENRVQRCSNMLEAPNANGSGSCGCEYGSVTVAGGRCVCPTGSAWGPLAGSRWSRLNWQTATSYADEEYVPVEVASLTNKSAVTANFRQFFANEEKCNSCSGINVLTIAGTCATGCETGSTADVNGICQITQAYCNNISKTFYNGACQECPTAVSSSGGSGDSETGWGYKATNTCKCNNEGSYVIATNICQSKT